MKSLVYVAAFAPEVGETVQPAPTRTWRGSWRLHRCHGASGAVGGKITAAAWKSKRSLLIITTQNHMGQPALQRNMAKCAGSRTVEIASSHAVMLTQPEKIAVHRVGGEAMPRSCSSQSLTLVA